MPCVRILHGHGYPRYTTSCLNFKPKIVSRLTSWICIIKQTLAHKEIERFYHCYKYAAVAEISWKLRYVLASQNISCPGKTNLMLDSVLSIKCLMLDNLYARK